LTHNLQQTVILAFQTPQAFGFGDAGVPVAFLPKVEGGGAAPEIAAELLYSLLALLSVLEEATICSSVNVPAFMSHPRFPESTREALVLHRGRFE
jgi:hypothetical protein